MQNSIDIIQHCVVNYIYKRGVERDASQRKEEALKTQTDQIELGATLLGRRRIDLDRHCNGWRGNRTTSLNDSL
ncbi:MAG: hypothetical protein V7L27_08615, partial [Nostoc sp.]|uniref:hypothetical protein n=1 Tax=Nostoc sp. TaxID=1180 RepID=UPI002FF51087